MEQYFVSPKEYKIFMIKRTASRVMTYLFLTTVALFIIIPFYWMLITSVKTTAEVTADHITLLPRQFQWKNYSTVFQTAPLLTMYLNTILVGASTTIFTVVSVVFMAFAFSRLNFKGRDLIFSILLMTMMIPGEVFVITNYITLAKVGWVRVPAGAPTLRILGNYASLIVPFIGSVFYTFFLRQTFKQIPNELYLAAKVDGVGDFKYLWKIMIPIAKATIVTIIILSMIGAWNAFVWPAFVTDAGNKGMFLVSNGLLETFKGTSEREGPSSILNQQMAGSMMVTLPILIVFFLLKKYIMRGVSRSGIKG